MLGALSLLCSGLQGTGRSEPPFNCLGNHSSPGWDLTLGPDVPILGCSTMVVGTE
jgi:hypothetical protein